MACAPRFYAGLGSAAPITFYDPESGYAMVSYSNQASTQIIGRCTTGATVFLYDGGTLLGSGPCTSGEFDIRVNFSNYPEGSITIQGIQISNNQYSSSYTSLVLTKATTTCSDSSNRVAGSFPLGSGTVGDPYIICTADQLTLIAGAHCTNAARAFLLADDLDLSAYSNWTALCANPNQFAGTFDGGHYRIDGLTMTNTGSANRGLFSEAAITFTLQNLRLRGVSITNSADYLGAAIGRVAAGGTLSRVSVRGTVTGTGGTYVGGVLGGGDVPISNSWAAITVTGLSSVGGLIGAGAGQISDSWTSGTITAATSSAGGLSSGFYFGATPSVLRSYSTASVALGGGGNSVAGLVSRIGAGDSITDSYFTGTLDGGASSHVGGLVADTDGAVTITRSYFTGTITNGIQECGGLVSSHDIGGAGVLTITESYSAGSITCGGAAGLIGGIVGWSGVASTINITDTYVAGTISGDDTTGGFVGNPQGTLNITTSYSRATVTASVSGDGVASSGTATNAYWNTNGFSTSSIGTGLTDAQMRSQASFAGFTFDSTHWVMGTYPRLYWE